MNYALFRLFFSFMSLAFRFYEFSLKNVVFLFWCDVLLLENAVCVLYCF